MGRRSTRIVLLTNIINIEDTSVKHKKSHREVVEKKDEDKDVKQSQIDTKKIIEEEIKVIEEEAKVIEEGRNIIDKKKGDLPFKIEYLVAEELIAEQLVTEEPPAVEESVTKESVTEEPVTEEVAVTKEVIVEEKVEEKEKAVEISEEVVVIAAAVKDEEEVEQVIVESHFDESSSTKSQPLSTATSSTDETDICTPEHEADVKKHIHDTQMKEPVFDWTDAPVVKETESSSIVMVPEIEKEDFVVVKRTEEVDEDVEADMPQFNKLVPSSTLTASAPEFVPKAFQVQQPKKSNKKHLTREQLIEQQRQHHIPRSKARCSHWPYCTNNNCKFFHPYKPCR